MSVLQWQTVTGSSDLRSFTKPQAIDQAISVLGIADPAVMQAAEFAGGSPHAGWHSAVLLQGSFRPGSIMRSLSQRGWQPERIEGVRCLLEPGSGRGAVTLGNDVIALGDTAALRALAGVYRGRTAAITERPPYGDIVERIAERRPVVLSLMPVPEHVADAGAMAMGLASSALDVVGLGGIGSLLSGIGTAYGFGYGLKPAGDDYLATLAVVMRDEEAAGMVAGGIGLVKGLAAVASAFGGPEQAAALAEADKITATREGDVVYFDLPMTRQQLLR